MRSPSTSTATSSPSSAPACPPCPGCRPRVHQVVQQVLGLVLEAQDAHAWRPPRRRPAARPRSRSPSKIGWPWGQVLASPIALSMRSSTTGDIQCSSRSASSCTWSQGMSKTSVRKRSISRWRRTMFGGVLAARVGEGQRLVGGARHVAVALEAADHLVHGGRRHLHGPRDVGAGDGRPASCSQYMVCRYSSSATVACSCDTQSSVPAVPRDPSALSARQAPARALREGAARGRRTGATSPSGTAFARSCSGTATTCTSRAATASR